MSISIKKIFASIPLIESNQWSRMDKQPLINWAIWINRCWAVWRQSICEKFYGEKIQFIGHWNIVYNLQRQKKSPFKLCAAQNNPNFIRFLLSIEMYRLLKEKIAVPMNCECYVIISPLLKFRQPLFIWCVERRRGI